MNLEKFRATALEMDNLKDMIGKTIRIQTNIPMAGSKEFVTYIGTLLEVDPFKTVTLMVTGGTFPKGEILPYRTILSFIDVDYGLARITLEGEERLVLYANDDLQEYSDLVVIKGNDEETDEERENRRKKTIKNKRREAKFGTSQFNEE